MSWAIRNPGTDFGAMPAKLLENILPTVIAGLAKLVELVKKYAAPMYEPTADAQSHPRPDRARVKMTKISPAVATTSENKCAIDARW